MHSTIRTFSARGMHAALARGVACVLTEKQSVALGSGLLEPMIHTLTCQRHETWSEGGCGGNVLSLFRMLGD